MSYTPPENPYTSSATYGNNEAARFFAQDLPIMIREVEHYAGPNGHTRLMRLYQQQYQAAATEYERWIIAGEFFEDHLETIIEHLEGNEDAE